jgi:hypothetical protein
MRVFDRPTKAAPLALSGAMPSVKLVVVACLVALLPAVRGSGWRG